MKGFSGLRVSGLGFGGVGASGSLGFEDCVGVDIKVFFGLNVGFYCFQAESWGIT